MAEIRPSAAHAQHTGGGTGMPVAGDGFATGHGHAHMAPTPPAHSADARKVVEVARHWVGRDFHPGQEAQCAAFVRAVFQEAHVPIGNARRPTDRGLLPNPDDLGPGYADSFAGDDVGAKISRTDVRPGDVVMYLNTYGNFRPGVITHVGIYVGDGHIVHRPTRSRPVSLDSIDLFHIGEIRRPSAYKMRIVHSTGSAKCFVHDREAAAFINGAKASIADIHIQVRNGHVEATVNGRRVDPVSLSLQLFY
ncbi:C40 family peptidase [Reyranella sp. CPCC 100927]|uniref:C40 family peptidase n=1 Tax=Reyranella sp. CPCC 100927 TaxID=2599616 RepID=UPI0011B40FBB|nr:NlpC/P60 family protein [Reyranella sp. CPCC 100927]TWT11600.1 hypothetical protein FQU96_14070 [Reyranella sp. CPCC 100927]